MKGQLKPGGLAMVVKSTDAEDVGKCVTLVKLVQPGESFNAPDGRFCRNRPENNPLWLVTGDVISTYCGELKAHGWALFPPQYLMPIDDSDPDAADERIYTIPIKCEVV